MKLELLSSNYLKNIKVFPRVIKVLMDKVSSMQAVSFNDLQNI